MKRTIAAILIALACAHARSAEEFTEAQLREIASKPHSPKLDVEELRIFPPARSFFQIRNFASNNRNEEPTTVDVSEKWVDGKYIVSEDGEIGSAEHNIRILLFDAKESRYFQYWLQGPKGVLCKAEGVRIGDSRAVNWKLSYIEAQYSMYDSIYTVSNTQCATFMNCSYRQNGVQYYKEQSLFSAMKYDFQIISVEPRKPVPGVAALSEMRLRVNLGKTDDYLKSRFSIYRDGKKLRSMTPDRAENGCLIFVTDDAKNPELAVATTDSVYLESQP